MEEAVTVSLGIKHPSGEYEVVPVATSRSFDDVWLPACERLGLELVALFAGGALTPVPEPFVPVIVQELRELRRWAGENVSHPYGGHLVERCDGLLEAFARTDPRQCEYDFG